MWKGWDLGFHSLIFGGESGVAAMNRRTFFIALTAASPLLGAATAAFGGSSPVFAENGVAIRGADAVAYFRGMGAVAGTVGERVRWRGAVWLFATPEHREMFERDPRRFAPRFGGYCAHTLAQGALGPADPRAFAIHDGRLYLLRSQRIKKVWLENIAENVALAQSNWPGALG